MLGIAKGRRLPAVLLIDDDLVAREVMATVLTMTGYSVQTATDAAEALSLLDSKACAPEVILMDIQMPGLNGLELIREIRLRTHALLYAISGSEFPEGVLPQVDGFLMKPFGPDALERLLSKHGTEAVPTPPTLLPAVNPKILSDFRAIMSEHAVREVYFAVAADLERRHTALESAIANRRGEDIRRIGHSMKGGCGMVGAMQAARLGELLETRGDDLEYSRSLLPHFQTAISNLKRMLDAEFSPQGIDPAA